MRRIIIIGVTGAGKTTLGRNVSAKLGLTPLDLDEFHWLPGWQERETENTRHLVDQATDRPSWAISGNYSKLQDIFWPKADTVVWLDYPFHIVFWQLLKRSFHRSFTGEMICNGNYESLRKFFSMDSIMVWLFKSFWKRRRTARNIFKHPEQNPHLKLIHLRHPKETEAWLNSLTSSRPSQSAA